jgi:hypothetical protein
VTALTVGIYRHTVKLADRTRVQLLVPVAFYEGMVVGEENSRLPPFPKITSGGDPSEYPYDTLCPYIGRSERP